MITAFILTVFLTLSISALCSVLEAMLLSTRSIEIERLKSLNPTAGRLLEQLRSDLEGSIASILTVNTVANTLGSVLVGALGTQIFGNLWLGLISATMTLSILFFSEILPKNIGVLYRPALQPILVYPLFWITRLAGPVTNFSSWIIRKILKSRPPTTSEGEIELLAEREARAGKITDLQLRLILTATKLQQFTVEDIMTPRSVVVTCDVEDNPADLLNRLGKFRFARMPVTGQNPDDIVGMIRRKDILHALATGQINKKVRDLMNPPVFVPEIGKLSSALELMIAKHQQLAVVVDEFGGFAGVLALEDIFECLIGREFYESDDVAVDMQEFARKRSRMPKNRTQKSL
ncbi:MAG: CNNM domain-containing protein [Chthoniobacterales bacterium]|nr:CNNM domain-containing protein [Chthoniobacterales bacterium]